MQIVERIYFWLEFQRNGLAGFFFLIQMSSCVLSIYKNDLPQTAPVINPLELVIILFALAF